LTYTVFHSPGLEEISVKRVGERGMMVTAVVRPSSPTKPAIGLPDRRYDHLFFSAMALLMLGTVFVGFAHTYYLAGVFHAPLPSLIIHLHGAAFSCWILLLMTQTSLVSAGRVDIHRRLGIAGFLLACLMIILGVLAATDSLVRGAGPAGGDPKFFYIIPLTDMLIFATLIFFAFRARSNPAAHKRVILVATIGLTIAAIARWPFVFVFRNAAMAALLSYLFLIILATYDVWSTRKVHRATLWASAFLIFVQQIRLPIGKTEAWHAFATWAQTHAR
jgi:FtsH-binding integral membrane protein